MRFEIEKKFRVESFEKLKRDVERLGGTPAPVTEQIDCYYQHPQRDFAETDESLRMRQCGEATYLTYKGPKFDAETKSRVEEEVRLADGRPAADTCRELVRRLGFTPVAVVRKERATFAVEVQGRAVEIALDEVEHVGRFAEIETTVVADGSDDPAVEAAKAVVQQVADSLGLEQTERRSYLRMLLENRGL